jgi:hypothetical protein
MVASHAQTWIQRADTYRPTSARLLNGPPSVDYLAIENLERRHFPSMIRIFASPATALIRANSVGEVRSTTAPTISEWHRLPG